LLIGGTLENGSGERLSFWRRKKRKDDLLDADERPLPSETLAAFLNGVDRETFLALFGIDHDRLVSGGREILAQEGHLGRSLFSAGTGISSLKRIHQELVDDAERIFKPRGSTQALNLALAEHRALLKSVREASLLNTEHQGHQQALHQAVEELERLSARRAEAVAEKRRLERMRRALPELARLEALQQKLTGLGKVPALPDDFPLTRQGVQERRREQGSLVKEAGGQLQEIRGKLGSISLRVDLLDHAQEIDSLNKGLERYAKDRQDRQGLEGNRRQLKRDAGDLLRLIRPDVSLEEVERLYPVLASRNSLLETVAREGLLRQVLQQADRLAGKLETEFESVRKGLQALPADIPVDGLKEAVRAAQRVSGIDAEILSLATAVDEECSACTLLHARQRLCTGDLETIPSITPPLPATLSLFAERFAGLAKELEDAARERQGLEQEQARIGSAMRAMELASDVPTEKELLDLRSRRDRGWSLLRLKWIERAEVDEQSRALDPDRPLAEAYEHLVAKADGVGDRLRREAERVHAYARLSADLETHRERLLELSTRERALQDQQDTLDQEWKRAWSGCPVAPLSPSEMIGWSMEFERLQARVIQMQSARGLLARKRDQRNTLRIRLFEELDARGDGARLDGEELAPVLDRGESCLERLSTTANRRALLNAKQSDLEAALANARDEQLQAAEGLASWQKEWASTLQSLGLPASTRPVEVKELIDTLQEVRARLMQADAVRKRMDGLDRDIAGYEERVLRVVRGVAPALASLGVESAVDRLSSELALERERKTLLHKLEEDESNVLARLSKGQAGKEAADGEWAGLLALAGCGSEEEVVLAEERWTERREVVRRIGETELRLADIGEGFSLDQLAAMAQGVDPDRLPERIEELERVIEYDLEPAIKRLHESVGMERKELERMDGSARAAEAAEQAEYTLARIRRLAEHYVRLKLASRVLDREIERFRAQNQDPVLEIASRYFQGLTLGSFAGLRADVNDQGVPVLLGVRPDNGWVPVEGMSSGTRDQLYLSLRLASLQWRMKGSEPLPFVVDDILVNFDDARAEATLQALAEFARSTQVILFTHHLQTVRTAETLGAHVLSLTQAQAMPSGV
jgi:uncharacterized protein YhaN